MIPAPTLPSLIASRYVPIRLIARGGMGSVYEVEHSLTGERLALKVLRSALGTSDETLERFKREARASARIKSEHVVHVTDANVAEELDGAPFLVMELLDGKDLEQAAAAAPSPAEVVAWLRQIAPAIDKAHRLGIVHRDLKPENLFLTARGDGSPLVKILDFGIAKMLEEGTGATSSGQIIGTPAYMAPEQASANARVSPATDRYALGLIAYRLLARESYYKGDPLSVLGQILHEALVPPSQRCPGIGGAFDAWFLKACARVPEQRFGSAAEQIDALAAALGMPTAAIEAPRLQSHPRFTHTAFHRLSSRGMVLMVGVVLAICLSAAAIVRLRRSATRSAAATTATPTVAVTTGARPSSAAGTAAAGTAAAAAAGATAAAAGEPPRRTGEPPRGGGELSASAAAGGQIPSKPGIAKRRAVSRVPDNTRAADKPKSPATDPFADQK